jgi:hypothetical protein
VAVDPTGLAHVIWRQFNDGQEEKPEGYTIVYQALGGPFHRKLSGRGEQRPGVGG